MALSMVPAVAEFFGVSINELVGSKERARRRGPASKLERQLEFLHGKGLTGDLLAHATACALVVAHVKAVEAARSAKRE